MFLVKKFQLLFRWTYFLWMSIVFLLGFFILFPVLYLIIQKKQWHPYYYTVTKIWGICFYTLLFLPVKRVWEFKPVKNQVYVYCPNHFSFLDIPLLTLTMPAFFVFVGLHNLEKIPFFGYMYRKIHIPVNRRSFRNRYQTYEKAKEALDEGKNLVIFPEGGIWSEDFPEMYHFKEGPFRIAIEKQIPIVPVSIPFNWKLMPLLDVNRLRWHRSEIIYHQPIETQGMTLKDLERLKKQTFQIIDRQLKKSNGIPHKAELKNESLESQR